jgi:hypothetical protein
MTADIGDRAQVENAKKKERIEAERRKAAVAKIMADTDLQHLVFQFLQQCRIYETSFTGNSETFFREGMRTAGHWWIGQLEDQAVGNYPRLLLGMKQ